MSDFTEDFIHQLETGSQALEDAGYDILGYQGEIVSDASEVQEFGDTPEEALNKTLSKLDSNTQLFFHFTGNEFLEAIQEDRDPSSLLYRNLRGIIEIDEPRTQPDWADEPVLAFGTMVTYVPEHPNNHWEVTTMETQPPYTREDAHEHAEDIITALEEYGLEAEKGYID